MWKRISWSVANTLAAVVLILLLADPTRPLLPIFILLGTGVMFMVLPTLIGRSRLGP
jgi:hypothetical protein